MRLKQILIAVVAAGICCLPVVAHAAPVNSARGITITPFLQKISLADFEATKTFTVQVTNHTASLRNFTVTAADFGSLNETGGIAFIGLHNDYSQQHGLSNWLTINKMDFSLKAGATTTLTGTVHNDSSLPPGGHYGALLINEVTGGKRASDSVSTNPTVSSLIFADKLGGEKYDLHLTSFHQNGNWFHLPSSVSLRFYNPGNVEVTPRGTIDLLDSGNHLVKRGIINEDSGIALPGSYRQMHVDVAAVTPTGWWPAHYTLAIHYRYDGTTQTATKQIKVLYWNLPHLFLLLILLTGVIAAGHQIYRLRLWKTPRWPLKKT